MSKLGGDQGGLSSLWKYKLQDSYKKCHCSMFSQASPYESHPPHACGNLHSEQGENLNLYLHLYLSIFSIFGECWFIFDEYSVKFGCLDIANIIGGLFILVVTCSVLQPLQLSEEAQNTESLIRCLSGPIFSLFFGSILFNWLPGQLTSSEEEKTEK